MRRKDAFRGRGACGSPPRSGGEHRRTRNGGSKLRCVWQTQPNQRYRVGIAIILPVAASSQPTSQQNLTMPDARGSARYVSESVFKIHFRLRPRAGKFLGARHFGRCRPLVSMWMVRSVDVHLVNGCVPRHAEHVMPLRSGATAQVGKWSHWPAGLVV